MESNAICLCFGAINYTKNFIGSLRKQYYVNRLYFESVHLDLELVMLEVRFYIRIVKVAYLHKYE